MSNNISINGSGKVSGGTYDSVNINGSGSINGDLTCQTMTINGSGSVQGSLTTNGSFTINGSGLGHNVGMSQWGAYAMAQQGFTYDQILKFYFTGVTIGN